jgi:hypothetical protein
VQEEKESKLKMMLKKKKKNNTVKVIMQRRKIMEMTFNRKGQEETVNDDYDGERKAEEGSDRDEEG